MVFLTKDTTCQVSDPRAVFSCIKFNEIKIIQNNAPLCPYKSLYSLADDFRAYSFVILVSEDKVDMV